MSTTQMVHKVTPQLMKVMERAQRDPSTRFLSLAHLVDEGALARAFHLVRKDAAVGVDGVTKAQYGMELQSNIQELHERLKSGRYRHQPIRQVQIPKGPDKKRPIGISSLEDKLVQGALREVLQVIYEPLFYQGSYGFRPGRSAHEALRCIDRAAMTGEMNWVIEADIQSYFDSIDRKKLMGMLAMKVADTSLLRLVGKCLHVGILDGEQYREPTEGTAQGSILSPLLGNIYLHTVLDEWFIKEVAPNLRGRTRLVRYADDFIIGFARREDADEVMQKLRERMGQFGLTLHPEKTRVVAFQRPPRNQRKGKGPDTFDLLGFTIYWRRARRGGWVVAMKTRASRLQRAMQAIRDFCRCHRHEEVKTQHQGLQRRLNGHFNYFGVNGNMRDLQRLHVEATRAWRKWLCRRGSKPMSWTKYKEILKALPLPTPSIRVQIWGVRA